MANTYIQKVSLLNGTDYLVKFIKGYLDLEDDSGNRTGDKLVEIVNHGDGTATCTFEAGTGS
jgi:hypothetical protein